VMIGASSTAKAATMANISHRARGRRAS
jgi:hypothetical protein